MAHSPGLVAGRRRGAAPLRETGGGSRPITGADPEKRTRILTAAIRTFGQRGFHEARIAEIAADAGVAEGTVYLYFKNKEDLLAVIFDDTMDGVLEEGRQMAARDAPAIDRLKAILDLHFSFLSSDRSLASVFQIELRRSARLVERFSRSKLVEYFRLLEGVIRDGITRGEIREDLAPRLGVRILFGAADEILSEWLISGDVRPAADGHELVETVFLGFSNKAAKAQLRPEGRRKGESR